MDKEILEKYIIENKSSYQIATIFGCSQTNVMHWLKKYGLKTTSSEIRQNNTGETKYCNYCQEFKSKDEFYSRSRSRCKSSYCKNCSSKYRVKKYRELKIEAVEYKGGKCEHCGYDRYYGALEFHHIDPKIKDVDWGKLKRRSRERIKTELDKCLLLCSNCHKETHKAEY